MRTRKETAGAAAIVAAVTAALTLAVLAVAASAAVVPAAGPASVETLAAGSILGGDPGQPLLRAANARAAAGEYGGGTLKRGRPNSRGHGFVRDARGFAKIDVPGASITAVFGSNRGGQIVGAYLDARKRVHGFRREGRRLRTIDFPGAKGTFASGINDRGRVVGSYTEDARTPVQRAEHGFLLDERGRFRRIDVPGATVTLPAAINNRGQIAIDTVDPQLRHHSFLLDRGRFTEIRPRGAYTGSLATDVDDRGRVIGWVL